MDIRANAHHEPAYLAINPKSKVPALGRGDGSVLTEYPAIALYLALSHPEKHLLPAGIEGQVRALEAMDYVTATLHAFWRMVWRPGKIVADEREHPALRERGLAAVLEGLRLVDEQLDGKDYLLGDFSIADSAVFFIEFWLAERSKVELPRNCAAHYARMMARPSVQNMLRQEGIAA